MPVGAMSEQPPVTHTTLVNPAFVPAYELVGKRMTGDVSIFPRHPKPGSEKVELEITGTHDAIVKLTTVAHEIDGMINSSLKGKPQEEIDQAVNKRLDELFPPPTEETAEKAT